MYLRVNQVPTIFSTTLYFGLTHIVVERHTSTMKYKILLTFSKNYYNNILF